MKQKIRYQIKISKDMEFIKIKKMILNSKNSSNSKSVYLGKHN